MNLGMWFAESVLLNIRIQERSEGRTKEVLWINGDAWKSKNDWMNECKRSI